MELTGQSATQYDVAMLIPLNPVLDAVFTATKVYPVCVTAAIMSKHMDEVHQ